MVGFKKIIFFVAILFPVLIVFKNIFFPGPLAWGDAPHFFPEELKELVGEPAAWTNRGESFGGLNNLLWLSPLMILYGVIGNLTGNDLAIRLLFYFPSLVFAGFGVYLLTKYLKVSSIIQFFSILIYLLNTYYILLIDGGQVGVALAYGLFPLTLVHLKRLIDDYSLKSFYLSLIFLLFLTLADPRVAIIAIITTSVWTFLGEDVKKLKHYIPLIFAWAGLNMYWIYPLLKNGVDSLPFSKEQILIRWYHPLHLFSPHWPENLFGYITRPQIYFLGILVLIFLGIVIKRSRQVITFGLLFIIFATLSLNILPIGALPFGFAFRDSTKFFIPLVLFGGMLIGISIDALATKYKSNLIVILLYWYIVFLVAPAILGKMNFVLSYRQHSSDYQKIYEQLKNDNGFFRTAWFPERYPLAYETQEKPALDAKDLASHRPFAQMNNGEDVFNFLNNESFVDWFQILGIKYLILSGNPREISKNETQQKDWNTISKLINTNRNLEKVDWETDVPIYRVNSTYPRFYAVKQVIGVIGQPLSNINPHYPTLFFEDGKWDPYLLEGKDPNSLILVFNNANQNDLVMSLLQKYFISPRDAIKNEWATYARDEYLKYKYELLIRGVNFTDFDYDNGISFSTERGEKIQFSFDVPESGDYYLTQRVMVPSKDEIHLEWKLNPLTLVKGKHNEVIENSNDLTVFNVVALIPKKEFDAALRLADSFTQSFKVVDTKNLDGLNDYEPVSMESWGTLKYKFEMPKDNYWLIFSDKYNKLWNLRHGIQFSGSVPIYSMINGFYAEEDWTDLGVEFRGQENVRWGIYTSIISVMIIVITFLLRS